MQTFVFFAVVAILAIAGYYFGRQRSHATAHAGGGTAASLHSLPAYYGVYLAIWVILPSFLIYFVWTAGQGAIINGLVESRLPKSVIAGGADQINLALNQIENIAAGFSKTIPPGLEDAVAYYKSLRQLSFFIMCGFIIAVVAGGGFLAYRKINPALRARNRVEKVLMVLLIAASSIAILTTVGIVLSLLFESIRFFTKVPWYEFLFGLEWSPQTALRPGQVASSGSFGAIPVFLGTMLITLIAMVIAVPVGLFSAVFLSEYATPKVRAWVKPAMEVLAGIPTVVYGFFAALTVAPFIRDMGNSIGLDVASESALAAGVVMGIMIIPFVSSLSDDVINAVPQSLRDGAYGLGATQSETVRQVILPAALPGIVGAVLLAVSRAIGETMIVVMAAGLAANLTVNPFEAVTTVTVQIVTLLVGDQEFDSAKTLAAFALGLVLFIVTLILNVIALRVVQKYREKYD
jgi:phosphate transport system permease protein